MICWNTYAKRGVAPPTHSRSVRCRSFGGVISKACFFCKLLQDINKKGIEAFNLLNFSASYLLNFFLIPWTHAASAKAFD